MILYGLPILYTLALWWFSTGAIFFLDSRPQHTFRWSMTGATVIMAVAVYGLMLTGADTTILGAYAGFSIGLALWGWLEIGYYMGFMIGPRRTASPEGCSGWRHFLNAAGTTLYHELAAVALAALIAAVTWDMPNKVALWTFSILWVMLLSAKLNVFLGVPNLAEEFLPAHLGFLRSFMTRKPMNLLFPVSITLAMIGTILLVGSAASAQASSFEAVAFTMLATLMVLAVVEHWVLVLPLPIDALWRWSIRSAAVRPEDSKSASLYRGGAEPSPSHTLVSPGFAETALTQPLTP